MIHLHLGCVSVYIDNFPNYPQCAQLFGGPAPYHFIFFSLFLLLSLLIVAFVIGNFFGPHQNRKKVYVTFDRVMLNVFNSNVRMYVCVCVSLSKSCNLHWPPEIYRTKL